MYFLYTLVLCYALTVPTSVHTYVIVAGNLKDFQSLVKKLSHHLANHNKETVQENHSKYYEESKEDEETDKIVEYKKGSQQYQRDNSIEIVKEFVTDIGKKPAIIYSLKRAPKVDVVPLVSQQKALPVLDIDDIVEQVKEKLLQEILAKSSDARKLNAEANTLVRNAQEEQTQLVSPIAHKDESKKASKLAEAKTQVQTPVPLNVLKEEIQFEATYEETQDKDVEPQAKYQGHLVQSPKLMKVQPPEDETKKVLPIKNKSIKKVRFAKKVLAPANEIQEQLANIQQLSADQQPMKQLLNIEPQTSIVLQPSLQQQLNTMQKQIDQINRSAQQKILQDRQTVVEEPQLNIKVKEVNSKLVPDANTSGEELVDKEVLMNAEDYATLSKEEAEESEREKESEDLPIVNIDTKEVTEATLTVEDQQSTEEHEPSQDPTLENDDEVIEETTTPEEVTEGISNEGDNKPDTDATTPGETLTDKVEDERDTKIRTKDFGTPITDYLDDSKADPIMDNPPLGARKVMLL